MCGSGFDSGTIPALDGVKNTFFLLTLRREACHLLASDDRLGGRWVDNSREDCSTVASISINVGSHKTPRALHR